MKKLINRLSKGSVSSQYTLLRSDSLSVSSRQPRTGTLRRGYFPVYVGEEMERFIVKAEVLNHPIFVKLLHISAQEYGYEHQGILRIPCNVLMFERVLEAVRLGYNESAVGDLREIFSSVPNEML